MDNLVIIGAGGFGREVLWLVRDINEAEKTWNVIGFVDHNLNALQGLDVPVEVIATVSSYDEFDKVRVVCAVGDPAQRRQIVARLDEKGARWATLRHPTSFVGTGSTVGEGSILCREAGVTVNSRIGSHVHFNVKSGAGHDTRVGSFSTLSGHVDINGGAVLEEGVFVGSHGVVLPGAHVGAWSRVGAGTVVLRNVPPNTTVFGVPAKPVTS